MISAGADVLDDPVDVGGALDEQCGADEDLQIGNRDEDQTADRECGDVEGQGPSAMPSRLEALAAPGLGDRRGLWRFRTHDGLLSQP